MEMPHVPTLSLENKNLGVGTGRGREEQGSGSKTELGHQAFPLKKMNLFNWRLTILQFCDGFCHTLT